MLNLQDLETPSHSLFFHDTKWICEPENVWCTWELNEQRQLELLYQVEYLYQVGRLHQLIQEFT